MTVVWVIKRAAQFRNNVNSFQKKVLNCFSTIGGNKKEGIKKERKLGL